MHYYLDHGIREPGCGVGHGERRGSRAGLGFDHFRAGILDPLGQGLELIRRELHLSKKFLLSEKKVLASIDIVFTCLGCALGDERHDGNPGVSSDDGAVDVGGVNALGLADKGICADDIQGADAEDALGVVHAGLLVDLRGDGDGAVDGVGDDGQDGLGAHVSGSFGQVGHDGGVCVEEVVTGHAYGAKTASKDKGRGYGFLKQEVQNDKLQPIVEQSHEINVIKVMFSRGAVGAVGHLCCVRQIYHTW